MTPKRTSAFITVQRDFCQALKVLYDDCSTLKKLNVNFCCNEITINRDFHAIIRKLRDIPKLKELDLVFYNDYYEDPWKEDLRRYNDLEVYKVLSPELKYLSQISRLTIRTTSLIMTNAGFEVLADGIRHLRNLSSLSLDLDFWQFKLSPQTVQKFAFAITRFNKLKYLDMKFKGFHILDHKAQRILWRSLSGLKNLETLKLDIFKSLQNDKDSFKSFFDESFRNLKKLSDLDLNFANWDKYQEMSTEMIESLFHGFEYLGKPPVSLYHQKRYFGLNLKCLVVTLPRVESFTEESVNAFAKGLLSIKGSLTDLTLNFAKIERLTDEEMLDFFKHLSSLQFLKILKLKFSGKPLTDYFLKNLIYRCSFLAKLSYLELKFKKTSQITNQGLRALSNGLSKIENLSYLSLNFGLLPKVSESSIQAFFYGLENLVNLTNLTLDFSCFSQVNDNTVFALSEGLANLEQLEYLDLNLSNCKNLTDTGLDYLADGLWNLSLLQTLRLSIYNCKNVNEEGIRYLVEGVQDLPNLSCINLDIYGSENISEEFMEKVKKKLKNKSALYFYYDLNRCYYDYSFDESHRKLKP